MLAVEVLGSQGGWLDASGRGLSGRWPRIPSQGASEAAGAPPAWGLMGSWRGREASSVPCVLGLPC